MQKQNAGGRKWTRRALRVSGLIAVSAGMIWTWRAFTHVQVMPKSSPSKLSNPSTTGTTTKTTPTECGHPLSDQAKSATGLDVLDGASEGVRA